MFSTIARFGRAELGLIRPERDRRNVKRQSKTYEIGEYAFHFVQMATALIVLVACLVMHFLVPLDSLYITVSGWAGGFLFGKFANGFGARFPYLGQQPPEADKEDETDKQ